MYFFSQTMLPIILGHEPGGTSTRTVIHYAQEYNSGEFQKFDYGIVGNVPAYGQMSPPKYDLKRVKVPVYAVYSDNDYLADPEVRKVAVKSSKVVVYLDFAFAGCP